MKRVVGLNHANGHVVIEVNLSLEVDLDACVSLSCIEASECIFHVLIELVANIAHVQVTVDLLVVSNFIDFGSCELDGDMDLKLLIFLSV